MFLSMFWIIKKGDTNRYRLKEWNDFIKLKLYYESLNVPTFSFNEFAEFRSSIACC